MSVLGYAGAGIVLTIAFSFLFPGGRRRFWTGAVFAPRWWNFLFVAFFLIVGTLAVVHQWATDPNELAGVSGWPVMVALSLAMFYQRRRRDRSSRETDEEDTDEGASGDHGRR